MELSISPQVLLARERRRKKRYRAIFSLLALTVALTTVILLINPATTQEYDLICGLEAHTHGPECWETFERQICELDESPGHVHDESCYTTRQVCICGLEDDPEHEHTEECFIEEQVLSCGMIAGEVHEHTAECIEWVDTLVCGMEDDPDHVHTDDCWQSVPIFVCKPEPGVGHVHNEYCFVQESVLTCTIPEHEHTEACYPKLKGDPHAHVEVDIDWESSFCNVELTGDWAEDLIAIAESQLGYAESDLNFVTDEYNIRHGYTRYGDWYGNRYAGWNALYIMFCMHYANIYGIPTDSVPANWMNAVRAHAERDAQEIPESEEPPDVPETEEPAEVSETEKTRGIWMEADGEPRRGDLVFFDDNADGLADRVAIVTKVTDEEILTLIGGTRGEVCEEIFEREFENIIGYLALPENPDPPVTDNTIVSLENTDGEQPMDPNGNAPVGDLRKGSGDPDGLTFDGSNPTSDDPNLLPGEPSEEPPDEPLNAPPDEPPRLVELSAQTEDGIRVTLVASSEAFPCPTDDLVLRVLDAQDAGAETDAVNADLENRGLKSLDLRWLDISVWRWEPVISEACGSDASVEEEAGTVIDSDEFFGEAGSGDQSPETSAGPPEGDEREDGEAVRAAAEMRLVEVIPTGPVEITVEGLSEDGTTMVYRADYDGSASRLDAHSEQRGRVTLITDLN